MEDYMSIPKTRIVELIKSYFNYRKMKSIIGKYNCLNPESFKTRVKRLLIRTEKLEALFIFLFNY
jgi:hypothetical protein